MNIIDMLKSLNPDKLQNKADQLNKKLAGILVEGASGGELVVATINGHGKLTKLSIDDSLVQPDKKNILSDLLIAAINTAQTRKEEKTKEIALENMMALLPEALEHPFGSKEE